MFCPDCGKECKDKRGLSVHLKRCSQIQGTVCSHCHHDFKTTSNLDRHSGVCVNLKLNMLRQEYEQKISQLNLLHDETCQSLASTYENKVRKIETDYETQSNLLQTKLVTKILNMDKEIQSATEEKLNSEQEKWIVLHTQETEELRKQILSLLGKT